MSKNINQYKSAMDNIRMSESFAKRTETLLKEIPENKEAVPVGSSRISLGRIVLTAGTGLAACLLIAAAIRGNVLNDTESTAVTTESQVVITEITTDIVTLETEAVYVEIDDSAFIDEEIDEKFRDELDRLEEEAQTSTSTTAVQTQKQPAEGAVPQKVNDNAAVPEYENDAVEEEVVEEAVEEEANMDGGAPGIGLMSVNPNSRTLYNIDFSNASMEIQSYVNASDAADIKVDSAEKIRELTAFVGDIAYSTPLTQQNKTFISEYVVNISEGGKESFTIYVTDRNSVIITVHYDDNQVRTEYLLSKDKYRDIEKKLYLYFGTETEYEAFLSLKSGK